MPPWIIEEGPYYWLKRFTVFEEERQAKARREKPNGL
jgi:hypothetical protein